ncbi:Npun_R2821/Npun_R2822 family protein [Oscillatoria salina]|uniref:Npun_R2821/Npun_R2822 family protein n=1 Tax=Oscillatoria salina TaxID=331517 RepID=UPI0013BE6420|nr:Npun_R2821/Npun_R2822 family protein [Oscillatoria salina]MBZ8183301.1 methionine synthase [Oscillatoria salina IIICB1]NET87098.1 methionine synthase [Kamptonema sp. SIO1D9]
MTSQGIYTLANDNVYDQLVALLNSIEVNVSSQIPICIIPYDDRLELVKQEIASRPNVTLFENTESIQRWEDFAREVWAVHPRAKEKNLQLTPWYQQHLQRKFVAFDGDFDKFVFYDGDSLAMKPLDDVFAKLDTYDFVFDDWEHKKPEAFASLNISQIVAVSSYQAEEIRSKLHCGSFFASKRGLFSPTEIAAFKKKLIADREINWINEKGWWDDVFLFNYLTLRAESSIFNYTLSPNSQERTGNCANADPLIDIDNILYNQQGQKPIHRIHYMGYPYQDFTNLAKGKDVDIPHKNVFLHYRFLKEPENKPEKFQYPNLLQKTKKKIYQFGRKLKAKMYNQFRRFR